MPCGPWVGSWDRRGRWGKTDLIILSLLDDCDPCAMRVSDAGKDTACGVRGGGAQGPPRPRCHADHRDWKLSEKQRVQEGLVGPLLSPWMQDENLL